MQEVPTGCSEGIGEQALKGHLDMLVLSVVDDGVRHGYAIIEAIRSRSGGILDLPEGTVYPLLHRLEQRRLLASAWTREGRRRRLYRLTDTGREFLDRQREEWSLLARAVETILAR
jgi:DNA-binding PadR family transcriptional regulator